MLSFSNGGPIGNTSCAASFLASNTASWKRKNVTSMPCFLAVIAYANASSALVGSVKPPVVYTKTFCTVPTSFAQLMFFMVQIQS